MSKRMKVLIAVLVAILLLTVGGTATVMAQEDEPTPTPQTTDFQDKDEPPAWGKKLPRILRGEVIRIDEGKEFFVIKSGEQEHTIAVGEGTKYIKASVTPRLMPSGQPEGAPEPPPPGEGKGLLGKLGGKLQQLRQRVKPEMPSGEKATFDDIKIGSRVVVWLVPGENKPTAKVVVIILKPVNAGRVGGTITNIDEAAQSITIAPANGAEEATLKYDENTLFTLKGTIRVGVGQTARAIYNTETMVAKVVRVGISLLEPEEQTE